MLNKKELAFLKEKAKDIRHSTIDQIGYLGVGHIGGALSIVEVLVLLYYKFMDITPANPKKNFRDKLVLSKGHAGPTLYSILADKCFFPESWLHTLNMGGTKLPSHCDMNLTPGIDMTTGSLGQGISAAIGLCLANRLDNIEKNIYLIIGDGESNEGQIWEGAMAAAHFKLNHLIAFTDNNKMGIDGLTKETMNIENLESKWGSFGWFTQRVDGHDFQQLEKAINAAQNEIPRPSMIIMETIKGKGAFFAEGRLENHNMKFDYQTAREACEMLK